MSDQTTEAPEELLSDFTKWLRRRGEVYYNLLRTPQDLSRRELVEKFLTEIFRKCGLRSPLRGFSKIPDSVDRKYWLARLAAVANPNALQELLVNIDANLNPHVDEFQATLDGLAGKNFETFEENKRIATLIQEIARRLNLLFVCPRCEEPARLKCVLTGNSKTGVFRFAHTKGTHGAVTTLPKLEVIKKKDFDAES